jgi:hypothetical protein
MIEDAILYSRSSILVLYIYNPANPFAAAVIRQIRAASSVSIIFSAACDRRGCGTSGSSKDGLQTD